MIERRLTPFPTIIVSLLIGILVTTYAAHAVDVIVGIPPLNPDPGQEFQVDITVEMGSDVLGSYLFRFVYDPAVVNIVSIDGGLTSEFSAPPTSDPAMFTTGSTLFAASQPSMTSPSGFISVAQLTLVAVGLEAESSNLDVEIISLNDGNTQPISSLALFPSSVLIGFDAIADPDDDGLNNQGELTNGTDFNNPDTDGDSLEDGFEVFGGLDPLDDGSTNPSQGASGDPDNDGHINSSEAQVGSNPNNDHSQPVDMTLNLDVGEQLVFYPANLVPGFSAFDLLNELNTGSDSISEIQSFQGGNLTQVAFINNGLEGDDFPLSSGEGVLAFIDSPKSIPFLDAVDCPAIDFFAGANMIGIRCIPSGYSAFQMLSDIGDENSIVAIQRLNRETSRYETAIYENGIPTGIDFSIQSGEAYIVHMLANRFSFDPLQ